MFQLKLSSEATPLSLLRVKLSYASVECVSTMATVSLSVLREVGVGLSHDDGVLLCGPVELLPHADITGQSLVVTLSHPSLLLLHSSVVLQLAFDDLFPEDYCKITERVSKASDDKKADSSSSVVRRRPGMRSRITKRSPAPEKDANAIIHTFVHITAYTRGGRVTPVQREMLCNIYREELVIKLLVSCCGHVLEEGDMGKLSSEYHSLVRKVDDNGESVCEREMEQYQSMDILCWIVNCCGQDVSNR